MTTKQVKIQIIKSMDDSWEVFGKVLHDLQYSTWKMSNIAMQITWDYQNFDYAYKTKFGHYFKEEHGTMPNGNKNIGTDIKRATEQYNKIMNGDMKDAILNTVNKIWKANLKDILNGEKSIPSFKRTIPIEVHNKQMMDSKKNVLITRENNGKYSNYHADIALISDKYAKEGIEITKYVLDEKGKKKKDKETKEYITETTCHKRKNGRFKLALAVNDAYQMAIVDRVMSGEYKLSMSKIIYDQRKKKWFLMLAYSFEPKKVELDKDKIMGIDVGVNVPATLAINNEEYYKKYVGIDEIKDMNAYEAKMMRKRKKLQQSRSWAGDGSRGHGRKTLMKPLDKLGHKIANYKDTKNHCWSRFIVNEAVKNGCGTIQMEDLTGISTDNLFLKRWTYYDLQTKIINKAKEVGIEVVKIDPKHTSGRCSKCGHIHRSKDKDQWRPTQDKFICQSCGYSTNADYNASKNIAIKDIDKIIKADLKNQDKILVSNV